MLPFCGSSTQVWLYVNFLVRLNHETKCRQTFVNVIHLLFFQGKIGLNAAHMVMELIRDNRKIVDRITHDHIDTFIDYLKQDKNYRYLDLLSVLCVCDGVSIADNQKYITEAWLMKSTVRSRIILHWLIQSYYCEICLKGTHPDYENLFLKTGNLCQCIFKLVLYNFLRVPYKQTLR